jgi:SP family general alpha glucoside:H+ symporter-like MFS transporter
VRAGRLDEAEHSLKRLAQKADNVDHKQAIALMVHTTELEKEAELGTSYVDCFKGTNLRRTEIACFSFMSQVFNGGALVYSPTYFLEQSGLAANPSYGISLGATGLSFIGTCLSWVLLPRFGRRPTFLVGFYIMLLCLWLIAILACVGGNPKNIAYGQASLALVWQLNYSMTVGPIVYTIVAEIGATRLRTKTVVLGRSSYYVANIIGGVFESYMVNPSAWNWKGKAAFFWGILSLITTIWAWFRLPETKNRTFEELDILFLRKIPSRKFVDAKIEEEDYSVLAHHNA